MLAAGATRRGGDRDAERSASPDDARRARGGRARAVRQAAGDGRGAGARRCCEAAETRGAPAHHPVLVAVPAGGDGGSRAAQPTARSGSPYFADVPLPQLRLGRPAWSDALAVRHARGPGSGALGNVGSHAIHVLRVAARGPHRGVGAYGGERSDPSLARRPRGTSGRRGHGGASSGRSTNGAPVSFLVSSVAHEVRSSFGATLHFSRGLGQLSPPSRTGRTGPGAR